MSILALVMDGSLLPRADALRRLSAGSDVIWEMQDLELEEMMTDERVELQGTVEVPRAALHGFRGFLSRFRKEAISNEEWMEKMRWIDSLLEVKPSGNWTPGMSEALHRARVKGE